MAKPHTCRFGWQHQLVLQGAMFAGAIFATLLPMTVSSALAASKDSPKAVVDEVWQIVNREYVDGSFNHVDWQQTRVELLKRKYHNRQEAYTAIRSSLNKLGDRYTRFLEPQEFQSLTNETNGETSGVGIVIEADSRTRRLVVTATLENSPAAQAGIKAGDTIVAIDGKSTRNLNPERAVNLIRGETGKSLVVKIARGEMKPFDVPLIRTKIAVAFVHSTKQSIVKVPMKILVPLKVR